MRRRRARPGPTAGESPGRRPGSYRGADGVERRGVGSRVASSPRAAGPVRAAAGPSSATSVRAAAARPTKASRPSPADGRHPLDLADERHQVIGGDAGRRVVRGAVLVVDYHDRPPSSPAELGRHGVAGHGEGDPAAQTDPADLGRGQRHEGVQRPPPAVGCRARRDRAPPTGGAPPSSRHRSDGRGDLGDGRRRGWR